MPFLVIIQLWWILEWLSSLPQSSFGSNPKPLMKFHPVRLSKHCVWVSSEKRERLFHVLRFCCVSEMILRGSFSGTPIEVIFWRFHDGVSSSSGIQRESVLEGLQRLVLFVSYLLFLLRCLIPYCTCSDCVFASLCQLCAEIFLADIDSKSLFWFPWINTDYIMS